MIASIPPQNLASIGRTATFFRDYQGEKRIVGTLTEEYFKGRRRPEKEKITNVKTDGLSMTVPLLVDIASLNAYLL